MASNYQVLTLPLDAVQDHTPIVQQGLPVRYFSVVEMTPGARAKLHVGDGPPFPVVTGSEGECCPAETAGFYLSTDIAQPGAVLLLQVGTVNLSQGL